LAKNCLLEYIQLDLSMNFITPECSVYIKNLGTLKFVKNF